VAPPEALEDERISSVLSVINPYLGAIPKQGAVLEMALYDKQRGSAGALPSAPRMAMHHGPQQGFRNAGAPVQEQGELKPCGTSS
jgi:hypothetical protein